MQRIKSGPAAVEATASPVAQPSRTVRNHQTTVDCTPTRQAQTPRVSSSFYRGLRFALVFDLFLVAFVVACCYLVGYIAVHVPAAVVILGCLVLIGLVVARGTAK